MYLLTWLELYQNRRYMNDRNNNKTLLHAHELQAGLYKVTYTALIYEIIMFEMPPLLSLTMPKLKSFCFSQSSIL